CSIAKVTPHKGRATLALPSWAKGVIAALASAASYVVVLLGIEAAILAAFPAGAFAATAVAGCVAGGVQSFVYLYIMGVTDQGKQIASALGNCLAGSALSLGLGQVRNVVLNWVRARGAAAVLAVAPGAEGAAVQNAMNQTAVAVAGRG
ncbi:hypothetical protein DFR72_117200, partial [Lentzea flaviverrucosa]